MCIIIYNIYNIIYIIYIIYILAVEANNDGNNIKGLFVVVLLDVCCLIFGCFLGDIGVGGLLL